MKAGLSAALVAGAVLGAALPAFAQAPRQDVIWARVSPTAITLDGNLNEAAWAAAQSITVQYAVDSGLPGSGWKSEGGIANPTDPTNATLKFLIYNNQLYMSAVVRDKSIGGSKDFNRFDGLLMGLKDHSDPAAPKPPAEYFYSWWYPGTTDPQPVGQGPDFRGRWSNNDGTPRTPEQIANWDAVTIVHGTTNSDTGTDTDYTVEMRFNLTPMGYHPEREEGDVIEWNCSIYDNDYFWPLDVPKFCANRVWVQSPWGNAMWFNELKIHMRPDVTTTSGPVPSVGPEVWVPNASTYAAPTIDGNLTEPVWQDVYGFDIRYGDDALRKTYPAVGQYRSGQFQPTVNGGTAPVIDPADATVKMFFKGNFLYLGFDFRDRVVQYHANFDRYDGALVLINEKSLRGPDNSILGRRLGFQVAQNGTALDHDYLSTLIGSGGASIALHLKAGTTVDTLGLSADTGYTAEMKIDLTQLGYPSGLGDGTLWIGVCIQDGDSFIPFTDSYGTRTWWFRQYEGDCCPAWAYLAPTLLVSDVREPSMQDPLLVTRSFPNPSEQSTIEYRLGEASDVTMELYDVQGRLVEKTPLGIRQAGEQQIPFDGSTRDAGLYLYRLVMNDPASGTLQRAVSGRIVVVR